jgi:hypothetical protein
MFRIRQIIWNSCRILVYQIFGHFILFECLFVFVSYFLLWNFNLQSYLCSRNDFFVGQPTEEASAEHCEQPADAELQHAALAKPKSRLARDHLFGRRLVDATNRRPTNWKLWPLGSLYLKPCLIIIVTLSHCSSIYDLLSRTLYGDVISVNFWYVEWTCPSFWYCYAAARGLLDKSYQYLM